jgi:hypothetical protein
MTLVLELTRDEEDQLRERAARQGQDAHTYALGLVRQDLSGTLRQDLGKTLAETLAGRIGLFEFDGPGYSVQEGGTAFAEHLVEKHRKGDF